MIPKTSDRTFRMPVMRQSSMAKSSALSLIDLSQLPRALPLMPARGSCAFSNRPVAAAACRHQGQGSVAVDQIAALRDRRSIQLRLRAARWSADCSFVSGRTAAVIESAGSVAGRDDGFACIDIPMLCRAAAGQSLLVRTDRCVQSSGIRETL